MPTTPGDYGDIKPKKSSDSNGTTNVPPIPPVVPVDQSESSGDQNTRILDPNSINTGAVSGPVVIFYGPREVGKTVALIRVSKYVKNMGGMQVEVNRSFRNDSGYEDTKKSFRELLRADNRFSPDRTGKINFVLLDYFRDGDSYCQFLEAPGEHFFDSTDDNEPRSSYVAYLQNIINRPMKKIYVFFFEENMFRDPDKRQRYADKVATLIRQMKPERDRVLILYNKVDEQPHLIKDGVVKVDVLKNHIFRNEEYSQFKVALQKSRLKHIYFVPFSSGEFPVLEGTNDKRWILGLDEYPQMFWAAIQKSIEPGWPKWLPYAIIAGILALAAAIFFLLK